MIKKLVVVAHPDDETLWAGGLILSNPQIDWTVLCITDGGFEGEDKVIVREKEFQLACEMLGVRKAILGRVPDNPYSPWKDTEVIKQLIASSVGTDYEEVYTHSPFDYHAQHREVFIAVTSLFPYEKIVLFSWGSTSKYDFDVSLDKQEYLRKREITDVVYASQDLTVFNKKQVESFTRLPVLQMKGVLYWICGLHEANLIDVWGFRKSEYEQFRFKKSAELLEKTDAVLAVEVGCCEGYFTEKLVGKFEEVHGIELNEIYYNRCPESSVLYYKGDAFETLSDLDTLIPFDKAVLVLSEVICYDVEKWVEYILKGEFKWIFVSDCFKNFLPLFEAYDLVEDLMISPTMEYPIITDAHTLEEEELIFPIKRLGTRLTLWRRK